MTVYVDALFNTHSHLRENKEGVSVVMPLIKYCYMGGVEIVLYMPNTDDGLTTADLVVSYDLAARGFAQELSFSDMKFVPTIMITEHTTIEEIDRAVAKRIKDGKVYPLNRTTNSENGVRDYAKLLPVIEHCGKVGMRVHFHPEHPWMEFDNRDAEFAFLPIMDMFLRQTNAILIWEHGTDSRCIPFWKEMAKTGRFFVTLTAHHIATDEDATFGDIRMTCKPSIKTKRDRRDLVNLIKEDHPWVMLGADDAPHPIERKHVWFGKPLCGAYTAPFLAQLCAHALDELLQTEEGKVIFVNFTSRNARKLYGFPPASRQLELDRKDFEVPIRYEVGPWSVQPSHAGQTLKWSLVA